MWRKLAQPAPALFGYIRGGEPVRRLCVIVGDTQQKLLSKLLEAKAGLTVDELAGEIDITRSAVKQHLTGMERSGYVQHTSSKSVGRPRFLYTLTESGIAARVTSPGKGEKLPRIECKNCVFHDLSKDYIEVCQFDLGFLSGLMGAPIEHQECMQRGGQACRFRFLPTA